MVVDFRKIYKQLKHWSYPIMRIDRIFSKLHDRRLWSTLDVKSSYYNITEDTRKYTAFTAQYGKYEFLHVTFGIQIAPSYLAAMINKTLKRTGLLLCIFRQHYYIIKSKKEPLNQPDKCFATHTKQILNLNWLNVTF